MNLPDKKESTEKKGELEPKQPEILQEILWIRKYGRKHWKLILLAILIWGIFVWPRFDSFSRFYPPTKKEVLNDHGKTTNQELKAEKKEIETNIETKNPRAIKGVQSKQFYVQEGEAYNAPELGLIVTVKRIEFGGMVDLRLVLPGYNKIVEKKVTSGEKWDFQIAETQYRLVVIGLVFKDYRDYVLFELSQIGYKQAEK